VSVYTVTLQGHAFAAAPRLSWTAEAVHNRGTVPATLAAMAYRIRLDGCRIPSADGAASGARSALVTFLTGTIHKAVTPTSLTITEGASALSEIGTISTSGGWDEIEVAAFDLPHSDELLLAGAEFALEVRARRVFPDSDGVVELERVYREQAGVDGLTRRELVSTIRMRDGTPVPTSGTVADLLALPLLPGWVREQGGTRGFDLEFTRYPRQDNARTVSVVRQVGGGSSAPEGSTGARVTITRREEVRRGYLEVTTSAAATGVDEEDGQAWLDERRPAGSWGEETLDELGKTADGRWVTRERLGTDEVVYDVRATLLPGGHPLREEPRSAGMRPLLRAGARRAWRLRVEADATFLAVDGAPPSPGLIRLVTLPPGASWRVDESASAWSLPRVAEDGASDGVGDVWSWSSATEWVWDSDESPLTQQLLEFVRSGPAPNLAPIFGVPAGEP
jgi:hypothetical protein